MKEEGDSVSNIFDDESSYFYINYCDNDNT